MKNTLKFKKRFFRSLVFLSLCRFFKSDGETIYPSPFKFNKNFIVTGNFVLYFLIISIIFLTSCITEVVQPEIPASGETPNNPGRPVLNKLPGYVGIKLFNVNAVSSKDTNEGFEYNFAPTEVKNGETIFHHFMLVYDNFGTFKGIFPLELPNTIATTNQNITVTVSSLIDKGNSEIKTANDLLNYLKGTRAYFLINIEEEDFKTDKFPEGLESYNESELQAVTLNKYKITVEGSEYFIMTNSSYLRNNDIICASPINITEENIFTSQEAAKKAISENNDYAIATGHLERIAVKYTVSLDNNIYNSNNNIIEGPEIQINGHSEKQKSKIRVVGFGIGGLEKNSYLFKKIRNKNYYQGWNNENDFRSYWAEDTHALLTEENLKCYPHQFRESANSDSIRYYNKETSVLKYTKFNELKDNLNNGIFYSLENTYFDLGMVDNSSWVWPWERAPYSAASHLLLACQLRINDKSQTLYKDINDIFYTSEEEILTTKLENFKKILSKGITGILDKDISEGSKLWIEENSGDYREASYRDLELIKAYIPGGDGQTIISPRENINFYLAPDSKSINSRNTDLSHVNLKDLLFQLIGPIDTFTDGFMYYVMPIPHNVEKLVGDSWQKLGAIGVVRNNWYNITISGINDIGTPVHDPDQPIIPVMSGKMNMSDATISIQVSVKPWNYNSYENEW